MKKTKEPWSGPQQQQDMGQEPGGRKMVSKKPGGETIKAEA